MPVILKYTGSFFTIIAVITLAFIFIGNSDGGTKVPEKAQKQLQQDETDHQYNMYFNFDGDQSQMIDLIKGRAKFNLVYSGKSKFMAKLLRSNGALLTLLANENGPYNRKQVIDVPESGIYLLDVKTAGEWSLSKE